ncbi:MAG TPA: hypothetical protein VJH20_00785 [Candidatus Nanoarchaeia archaeon]|nr:hypothetical protein [Candidatus Nanoarchaeia archaeon]
MGIIFVSSFVSAIEEVKDAQISKKQVTNNQNSIEVSGVEVKNNNSVLLTEKTSSIIIKEKEKTSI